MTDNLELDGPTPMRRISLTHSNSIANPTTNHHLHHLHHQSARSIDASVRRANVRHLFAKFIWITNFIYLISTLKFQFGRRASLEDLEQESCQLAPAIHHRIVQLQNNDHLQQLLQKKIILETNRSVIKEDDESPTQT